MTSFPGFIEAPIHDWIMGRRFDTIRSSLVGQAAGRVLEIGAGSGLNFSHYTRATEVTAIEPSAALRKRASWRAKADGVVARVDVVEGIAEHLPFGNERFDDVVLTFVLCSIEDVHQALREITRVLRPGGRMLLAEHVKSPDPKMARWQQWLQPIWGNGLGGCSLVRDSRNDLWQAGFDVSAIRAIELPLPAIGRAGIAGVVTRA